MLWFAIILAVVTRFGWATFVALVSGHWTAAFIFFVLYMIMGSKKLGVGKK